MVVDDNFITKKAATYVSFMCIVNTGMVPL